jgi:serine protease Do
MDEQVVCRRKNLKSLMDQFVCVRLVRAETLDLTVFQFDPDLSFAVFLLNADKTVYGRYGSRSDFYEAERDISTEGLAKALAAALDLHNNYQQVKRSLKAKSAKTAYKELADFPSHRGRSRRGFRGGRGHCTHCHDLRTAEQMSYRLAGKPVPDNVMFAWPMPDAPGLHLDPLEMATVKTVWKKSPAEEAGFKAGDRIESLNGQPILSIADVQWVLQNAGDTDSLKAIVRRGHDTVSIDWKLTKGWRRYMDISWRTTTDVLRRSLMYRVEYDDLPLDERKKLGLSKSVIALRAARGVSRNSGTPIVREDVVVAVDGQHTYMTEGDFIAYFVQEKKPGDIVTVTVLRDGQQIDVAVPVK